MINRLSLFLVFTVLAHADLMLTLSPNSNISGAPGSVIGWGFTLTSSDATYDLVTGSDFCLGSSDGINNSCISPTQGSYTDLIGSQFIVLGPSPESLSSTQGFNAATSMGVGLFTLNSNATGIDSGQIVITYDIFTQDPNSPNFDPGSYQTSSFVTAAASVTVVSPAPEPGSLTLVGTILVMALGLYVRRVRRHRTCAAPHTGQNGGSSTC